MAKNYYQILDLPRNCSDIDIIKAYKKLSLRYHPSRSKDDKIAANFMFNQVAEAYDVLSDYKKRSCYDQLGEFGLKQGGLDGKGGYKYLNNAEEIFQKFFKSDQILDTMFGMEDIEGSLFGSSMRGMESKPHPTPEPLKVILDCTLEDLYCGTTKNVEFKRIVLNSDRATTKTEKVKKRVEIHPGMKNGKEIVFQGEGNMSLLYPSSDLIFEIKQLGHDKFVRDGDNLKYKHRIRLLDALIAYPIEIETLDKRVITLSFEEIVSPETVKVIDGEGMPIFRERLTAEDYRKKEKGCLAIEFDVEFPKHISDEKKRKAIELLS